ncbi:hypothetical protein BpHYR1_045136 [Brachionus plicatilis]|uniref:Uncharacterized protein n=1 Tax=Brachionus plicatilis TaxID=10195 RepID=A0A3M7QQJ4_BRAPC|nr:hypothetical protein BpHYR1_045136 [Brachionus plicatilis]
MDIFFKKWPLLLNICIRERSLPRSHTTNLPLSLITVTFLGYHSCPSSRPGEPNACLNSPSLSNTWTRWLLVSATIISSSMPRQKPCGELNWVLPEPSTPNLVLICMLAILPFCLTGGFRLPLPAKVAWLHDEVFRPDRAIPLPMVPIWAPLLIIGGDWDAFDAASLLSSWAPGLISLDSWLRFWAMLELRHEWWKGRYSSRAFMTWLLLAMLMLELAVLLPRLLPLPIELRPAAGCAETTVAGVWLRDDPWLTMVSGRAASYALVSRSPLNNICLPLIPARWPRVFGDKLSKFMINCCWALDAGHSSLPCATFNELIWLRFLSMLSSSWADLSWSCN